MSSVTICTPSPAPPGARLVSLHMRASYLLPGAVEVGQGAERTGDASQAAVGRFLPGLRSCCRRPTVGRLLRRHRMPLGPPRPPTDGASRRMRVSIGRLFGNVAETETPCQKQ